MHDLPGCAAALFCNQPRPSPRPTFVELTITIATRAHAAHLLITALTAMEGCKARELYHTLRTAYNLPGTVPLPPLDEWHGISDFCEYFYCRYAGALLLGWLYLKTNTEQFRKYQPYVCPSSCSGTSTSLAPRDRSSAAQSFNKLHHAFRLLLLLCMPNGNKSS